VRVGVLTGGGDCPGLNAVLRAIVRKGEREYGDELVGYLDAWDGVLARRTTPLTIETMRGVLPRGGTVLGTRRGSPFDRPDGVDLVRRSMSDLGLDGLIVIGGNGSLSVACALHDEHGIPVLGVPKTIDNDIVGTEVTFGFNTAVQIATDAIDRLHTTAESHDRVMLVEVMGRHAGWIATHAGMAGGAAAVLAEPKRGSIEMPDITRDRFGHVMLGGIANQIAAVVGERTTFETRVVQLGHVQRGGTPTAYDRVLSTRFGVAAIDAAHAGQWGKMTVVRGEHIELEELSVAVDKTRTVDPEFVKDVAEYFFA